MRILSSLFASGSKEKVLYFWVMMDIWRMRVVKADALFQAPAHSQGTAQVPEATSGSTAGR